MPKMDLREQGMQVAQFVALRSPKWVSYHEVMYHMNYSATKAMNLCKVLDKLSDLFVYQNGDIRYNGKPDEWKEDLKYEG